MENEYYKNLPKKRMGAGAMFFNNIGEILIVKPTYKDHWSLPGGVVDENESPKQACMREIKEEIGIDAENLNFICVDYTPATNEKTESLQFIFNGGTLDSQQIASIVLIDGEIGEYGFFTREAASELVGTKQKIRFIKCLEAIEKGFSIYFEE
jgi:8-oxo-dGTP diphosphatase